MYLSCYYCYNPNYYPNTSNTFSYNTISNNVNGVYEYSDYSAGYNTYHHNTIANNSDYGMFLEYVYYNTIYNNDFVDNNNQVWDGYSYYNTWNLAAPTSGNYWSHYDTPAEGCDDTNSDGFCDLELYIPNYYGYDYLPLTTPANQQQQPELSSDAADVTVNEGDSANNSGTVSDPDGDTVTLSASVGTVINNNDGTWSWSFPTNDGPGESQTVTIDADDGNGGTAQTTFGLTVNNVAPAVGLVSVPTAPIDINNQPVTGVSAPFTDPGTADTHTCTADYGDGSGPQAGTVAAGVCSGPDQTYTEAGVYEVTVEVTDDDSGVGNATATSFIVIYDPSGGFVTGGGWIDSPSGAYTPDNPNDPDFSGKANFGFVAKYKKGADVPDGNTQFQFKAGDLNFHSSSYQWLVVAGARAQFKGEGTINGAGNYGFMLTAIDGQINGGGGADKFRIKIWDMDNGDAPIYDNLVGGGADDADPTTTLGGGRIVIHNK